MDKKQDERITSLTVTRRMGGMIETERTGKYPDYLYFHSGYYKKSWKHRVSSEEQTKKLTISGKAVFEYRLMKHKLSVRTDDGGPWHTVDMEVFMFD